MGRKWSPSSRLAAALAVVFGLAAFLVVRGYSERVRALAPELGTPVRLVVAARDLPRGTRLGADMLGTAVFPSRFAPPGALRNRGAAAGRVIVSGLARGEVLTGTRLAPARAGPISALVPDGFRAVPLAVELPPGAIRPGDRVDVLATFPSGRRHTETVATGLEVLSVMSGGGGPSGVIDTGAAAATATLVLLAPADETESLAYARAFAQVSVVVDGPDGG